MKILHVISGLGDGGAEAVLYRLITSDGVDVHHVVSLIGIGKYGPLLRAAGTTVTTLDMPRGCVTPDGFGTLWRTVRTWRPDVVQAWMYHADLLAGIVSRLNGIPVVWGIRHTVLDRARASRATMAVAWTCARLSRRVPKRIVCCAETARQVHVAKGYDARRMVVIPNGYDLARLAPDPDARSRVRRELGVGEDCELVGMVARFDPYKDHANLIATLGRLRAEGRRFEVVLVGAGMDDGNTVLATLLDKAGITRQVHLLGPRPDIPAVMNALDLHVLSSSAEAFPNVLAEAMACGTPCVATDVGDAARIVGETGWIVPPRDANALADAVGRALDEHARHDMWKRRQELARQRITAEFGIEKMVERYRAVWRAAATRSSTRREEPRCAG